jgi:hypothetical protein
MELDPNCREFIASLRAHDAHFLVVGGYAVGLHGHPRYTAYLDICVLAHERNAHAVLDALRDFGFGDMGLRAEDLLARPRGPARLSPLADRPHDVDRRC